MNRISSIVYAICFFSLGSAFATEPVDISDPVPALESTYTARSSNILIYTLYNHVADRSIAFALSGISPPVTRVKVNHDCGNVIPVGPTSSCNIGILISPTNQDIGKSFNQTLTIQYLPYMIKKDISFSVIMPPQTPAKISASQTSITLAQNGIPRTIDITATEGNAQAVTYEISDSLPTGTTISPAMCGDISEGTTCIITITPGPTPSAPAGSAPKPVSMKIFGINTNTITFNSVVLTQGNIYQQGYLFSIDDTTPATGGVGGQVVALTDISQGIQWSNGNIVNTNSNSLTDGIFNTNAIISAQGTGHYAASSCANYEIDAAGSSPCQDQTTCYKNWYLPAICQMGPSSSLSGCSPGTPNIVENLVKKSIGGFSNSISYWSSTEFPTNPSSFAWYQYMGNGNNSFQSTSKKYMDFFAVRCVREINIAKTNKA